MHIEVFLGAGGMWHWHFKNKGRVTADAEAFPSKANATRAAKSVVAGVLKAYAIMPHLKPTWRETKMPNGSSHWHWC